MLVDRSSRIWAMRRDEMMIASAVQSREANREGGSVMAVGGTPLEGSDFARVVNRVAVVPVRGLLMRQMSFWFWSYEEILRDVMLAQSSDEVDAILLDIDSPGGMAAGCGDCAQALRASGPKPLEAFLGGMAASAAYYLASAADRITVGSAAVVGSIGTVIEYVDVEPMFEKMGPGSFAWSPRTARTSGWIRTVPKARQSCGRWSTRLVANSSPTWPRIAV